jgi:hypothetical protein
MSEKYYIVSESELEAAIAAAFADGAETERTGIISEVCKTHEAACRAREVRFIGAADQGSSLMLWGEVKK